MSLKEPKIDPRIQRTREALQHALYELMRDTDFDQITVHDIADKARINRATFYDHFTDKYDLLSRAIHEGLHKALDGKLPPAPKFTLGNLRILTSVLFELLHSYLGHCAAPASSSYKPLIMIQMQTHVYEILLHWINQSQIDHTDKSPESVATLTSWVVFGMASQWAIAQRGRRRFSAEEMVDETLPLLISGLKPILSEE